MKFIPSDRFELSSTKSPDELNSALSAHVGKPKTFELILWPLGRRPDHKYVGKADSEGFKIWPAIRYQNSFLPIIVGCYSSTGIGTTIRITQSLSIFTRWFSLVWTSFVLLFLGVTIFYPDNVDGESSLMEMRLIPLSMLAFFLVLANGAFWWEARHTKDELIRILDVNEDQLL